MEKLFVLRIPRKITLLLALLNACIHPVLNMKSSKTFSRIGDGTILDPTASISVGSVLECAMACNAKKVCKAFSITKISGVSSQRTCRLSMGAFSWGSSPEETIYHILISNPFNYTLMKDGRYYIFNANKKIFSENIGYCDEQGATVAPCYRKEHQEIVLSMLPAFEQYVSGTLLTSSTYSVGRWVTVDGDVFNSNNKGSDPLQRWYPGTPNFDGTLLNPSNNKGVLEWDDDFFSRTSWPITIICRKSFGYDLSSLPGKYYSLHHEPVSSYEAAQQICQSEGGNLANVVTVTSFAAVEGYRVQLSLSRTRMLVGGTDSKNEGTWIFPDGSSVNAADIWWQANENDGGSSQNCLYVLADAKGVSDQACDIPDLRDKFLCEIIL